MTFAILTICTANICRSPVAQSFLRSFMQNRGVQIHSAGTQALNGYPADPTMRSLLAEKGGFDIDTHHSQTLLLSMVSKSNLLLCMENEHLDWIVQRAPVATAKVKLLGHWDHGAQVRDPTGSPRKDYEQAVVQIERLCHIWAKKLIDLGVC